MNELTHVNSSAQIEFSKDQIELIKRTIAKGATDDELKLFLWQAQKTGLDPLSKQIYCVKYGNSPATFITAIDGYRLIAHRTGHYLGEETTFEYTQDGRLVAALCKVRKQIGGQVGQFSGYARIEEYSTKKNKWLDMPHVMLAKCAEAQALRKAFPNELSAIYTKEEMEQAEPKTEVTFEKPKKSVAASKPKGFDKNNSTHTKWLAEQFKEKRIDDEEIKIAIIDKLVGRPSTELDQVIEELLDLELDPLVVPDEIPFAPTGTK